MLESLKAMPMKGKLTLAGSALGVVLVAFFLLQLATKPSYETLMSGVQPADTAKVTTALDGAGIAYAFEAQVSALVARHRLVRVLEDWCPYYPGFYLYYPSRRQMPAVLRAFVDHLQSASRV